MITKEKILDHYDEIQNSLKEVFIRKINQYGIKMYEAHTIHFIYWSAYFNCRRKTLRLEKLTMDAMNGDKVAKKKLLSDYQDLANYAIMAIQIIEGEQDGV